MHAGYLDKKRMVKTLTDCAADFWINGFKNAIFLGFRQLPPVAGIAFYLRLFKQLACSMLRPVFLSHV